MIVYFYVLLFHFKLRFSLVSGLTTPDSNLKVPCESWAGSLKRESTVDATSAPDAQSAADDSTADKKHGL